MMKKNIFLISALFLCVLITSCSESFLEELPEDAVALEDFYQDENDFELANVGMYLPLQSLYGNTVADYGAWSMGEMRSDNTCFIYNSSSRGYADREYVDLFTDDADGSCVSTKYEEDYIIIQRANQILKYIESADVDEDAYDNYKGQALFMRAFCYFDLVQYFGKVPLVTAPATTYDECFTAQSSVDSVYDQIISDATEAASLLPTHDEQDAGYVADGAAYTLLGNVYLVQEEWEKAITVLEKVSGYSLLDDFASIFDPDNKNNDEMIFEVGYSDDESSSLWSYFAYNFLPVFSDISEAIDGFPTSSSNSYGGWNTPTPDLIDLFDTAHDARYDASIGWVEDYNQYNEDYVNTDYPDVPYVKKYVHGCEISAECNDDFPVYRYSEVLLMLAEAYNESDDQTTALSYLNEVHANARTGLSSITTVSDKAALRDSIKKERQLELCFENKRWPDLVRWGDAIDVMTEQGEKIQANPQKYYYPEGSEPTSAAYSDIDEHRLLFPIPDGQIDVNPYLEQNDGY